MSFASSRLQSPLLIGSGVLVRRWRCLVLCGLLLLPGSLASAQCPTDQPPDCTVEDQFAAGRYQFSNLTGTYTLSGEDYYENDFAGGDETWTVSGSLSVDMVGGPTENYVDVACDGTVTGQGKDRIEGTIDKDLLEHSDCESFDTTFGFGLSSWDIIIERTYSITGSVTGTGEVELDLSIDAATLEFEDTSSFTNNLDCQFGDGTAGYAGLSLMQTPVDIERVRLTDSSYDPADGASWNPQLESLDSVSWLESVGKLYHLLSPPFPERRLLTQAEYDALDEADQLRANSFIFMEGVTATLSVSDVMADAKSPVITDLKLDEPSQFLEGVAVDTTVTVTVDWLDADAPQQIEFNYGSTTETVSSGGETTSWTFDAGETGTTIRAKATSGSGDSLEWEIATPKVAVPGWAGEPGDWSGSGGVQYQATLDWPVSLETTETVDSLSLVTGLWGVTGSITSEFDAKANSSGSPVAGSLDTQASVQLAGKEFSFDLTGTNSTTLECEDLVTEGDATAQFPELTLKKTLNPLTAIPGVESAVCSLSGLLCKVVTGVGLKGELTAGLSGSGMFMGEGEEIEWSEGSLEGSLSASINFQAVPPPLSSLVSLGFEGGGTGCLGFQFSPMFELDTLGGEVHVGLSASAFGLKVNPSHDWVFGDACSGRSVDQDIDQHFIGETRSVGTAAWVPADGQLAMAVNEQGGVAVWSELPVGQSRPMGNLQLRRWSSATQSWGTQLQLTSGVADMASAAEFDSAGNLLIVYQRGTAPGPIDSSEFAAFANDLELHYLLLDTNDGVLASGQLTDNGAGDFGPTLRRDQAGAIHLFWQRATDAELGGTTMKPTSIHAATWNSATMGFSGTESVATGLDFTFGWHPAAASSSEMLVALVVDTDQDYATAPDREIFQITKTAGVWLSPVQVTVNSVADDAPLAAFDGADPVLLWRQAGGESGEGESVLQLRGNLTGVAEVAFTSSAPASDGGISASLGQGLAVASGQGLALFWPESIELAQTYGDSAGWLAPFSPVISNSGAAAMAAESVHAVRRDGHEAIVGFAIRQFASGNGTLESMVEPRIGRVTLDATIFADGFESGDATAWSGQF